MAETVLITGSSRGIGRAIALQLAAEGYDIVVHCHANRAAAEEVAALVEATGQAARILQFDVADRDSTREILLQDIEEHGAYYGVVNNAGIIRDNPFPGIEPDEWDAVLRTNLDGFYNVLHPIIMPMIQRRTAGRIVSISSMSGVVGNRGQVNYSASKGGLIAASKALAVELAKRKITVNCVVPGIIETEMIADAALPQDQMRQLIPMQRLGQVEDVANAVSFLMSDKASYITRQVISVNGGMF
jgi:3-oxoacyl-[acyl-carrier protein] reductase